MAATAPIPLLLGEGLGEGCGAHCFRDGVIGVPLPAPAAAAPAPPSASSASRCCSAVSARSFAFRALAISITSLPLEVAGDDLVESSMVAPRSALRGVPCGVPAAGLPPRLRAGCKRARGMATQWR